MRTRCRVNPIAIVTLLAVLFAPLAVSAQVGPPQDRYIVVLKPDIGIPEDVAADVAQRTNGRIGYVYENVLRGFSITMPRAARAGVARDPRVAYIEEDLPVSAIAQVLTTGLDRIYDPVANNDPGLEINDDLFIDGVDDWRVDVDVAVLDTGIDRQHPDLNVVGGANCLYSTGNGPPWARNYYCEDVTEDGDDDHYHGTHVAGTIGAIDNDFGVVGVAPGARLYAVKVLDQSGSGYTSGIVAGIDWVVDGPDNEHIEVINMSLGGAGVSQAYEDAIDAAVAAGVVVVVAAGNSDADANNYSPAYVPSAITVSALADFNGKSGGLAPATCRGDQDDTLADFSNWGSAVDIAAPGVCIYSTYPIEQGGYGTISGTSMAAPHVAGAAALLASGDENSPVNAADVAAITTILVDSGNYDWIDDSGDETQERLLDVTSFSATFVDTDGGGGGVTNNPPTASFAPPDNCVEGLPCDFSSTSTDDDGSIATWAWDFNTGGTDASTENASWSFASSGNQTVRLTVTDDDGASDFVEHTVNVAPAGPGPANDCDGLVTGVYLTASSTNQGRTWTAIVDALNCTDGNEADFGPVPDLEWSPLVGTPISNCGSSGATCQSTQSGIRKNIASVTFTLNGASTPVLKP